VTTSCDTCPARGWKHTSTVLAAQDVGFWVEAQEYVRINKSVSITKRVCAAMSILSSASAFLSEAAIAALKLTKEISALPVITRDCLSHLAKGSSRPGRQGGLPA
jgi:hypothetical protein